MNRQRGREAKRDYDRAYGIIRRGYSGHEAWVNVSQHIVAAALIAFWERSHRDALIVAWAEHQRRQAKGKEGRGNE